MVILGPTVWDTSRLDHESQYEIRVRAYDGEDYSEEFVKRITISKPADENNIPPQFNATNWQTQITIFCVIDSSSENQCGGGGVIDLKQYFNDPDSNVLIYDFADDLTDSSDDDHPYLIDIDSQGIATYDPAIKQSNEDISSWTVENVRFIVRDGFDEFAVSRDVTFFVQAIKFDVDYTNPGDSVSAKSVAVFNGTGLPGAKVEAKTVSSDFPIKSVIVGDDGTWTMNISLQDLDDVSREIKFEMNGQTFGGSSDATAFEVAVGEEDGGMNVFSSLQLSSVH